MYLRQVTSSSRESHASETNDVFPPEYGVLRILRFNAFCMTSVDILRIKKFKIPEAKDLPEEKTTMVISTNAVRLTVTG